MGKQLISFVIPEELLRVLDGAAKEKGKSRSELLREGARMVVRREEGFEGVKKAASRVDLQESEARELIEKVREGLPVNQ